MEYKTISKAPSFEINKEGVIRNKKTGRIMSQSLRGGKRLVSMLTYADCEGYNRPIGVQVAREVLLAFSDINDENTEMVTKFKDGDITNTNFDNLEWTTRKEASAHLHDDLKRCVKLRDPEGVIHEVRGMRAFAKKHGFDYTQFSRLCNNTVYKRKEGDWEWSSRTHQCKGWTRVEEE